MKKRSVLPSYVAGTSRAFVGIAAVPRTNWSALPLRIHTRCLDAFFAEYSAYDRALVGSLRIIERHPVPDRPASSTITGDGCAQPVAVSNLLSTRPAIHF